MISSGQDGYQRPSPQKSVSLIPERPILFYMPLAVSQPPENTNNTLFIAINEWRTSCGLRLSSLILGLINAFSVDVDSHS